MAMNPEDRQAAADIQLIVGGNFTPDALGPLYQQTIERVRAAPDRYMRLFEQMYLARPMDLNQHSGLYLAALLRILADLQPARVKALAQRLLRQTDVALAARPGRGALPTAGEAVSEETFRMLQRVDMRQRELRNLLRF